MTTPSFSSGPYESGSDDSLTRGQKIEGNGAGKSIPKFTGKSMDLRKPVVAE